MAERFGSAAWARALERELAESSEYRNAARRWGTGFNGNVLLVFEADGALAEPLGLLLRLAGGRCLGTEFCDGKRHPDAGFVLRAPFGLWQQILARKTLAATAILTGRMRVEGDRIELLKHTAAHRALVHCVSCVDTDWSAVRGPADA